MQSSCAFVLVEESDFFWCHRENIPYRIYQNQIYYHQNYNITFIII